jgi:23S rRNA-/tRNA-specific pseudouridylate synthase
VTDYKVIKTFMRELKSGGPEKEFSILEVKPQTGRTHQIRVHLASIGHPIVGDQLYGGKTQPEWGTRLMLHASSLEFIAADGKRLKFEAEAPF